jgi:hypothetical protein
MIINISKKLSVIFLGAFFLGLVAITETSAALSVSQANQGSIEVSGSAYSIEQELAAVKPQNKPDAQKTIDEKIAEVDEMLELRRRDLCEALAVRREIEALRKADSQK